MPFVLTEEKFGDRLQIEEILDRAFGLSRRTKTSYRLREGELPVPGLSLVARPSEVSSKVLGTISFWRIFIGEDYFPALLLGPLAVDEQARGMGVGLSLMRDGLGRATALGEKLVLLVGDTSYYERVGFQPIEAGRFLLPGPVDPKRFLYLELVATGAQGITGLVLPPHRISRNRKF